MNNADINHLSCVFSATRKCAHWTLQNEWPGSLSHDRGLLSRSIWTLEHLGGGPRLVAGHACVRFSGGGEVQINRTHMRAVCFHRWKSWLPLKRSCSSCFHTELHNGLLRP